MIPTDLEMIQEEPESDATLPAEEVNEDTEDLVEEQKEELPEEIRQAILTLYNNTRLEDETIRIQALQKWRALELFWEGFQNLFWDFVARDWRLPTDFEGEQNSNPEEDRILNIYRAHGESVIAALSINVPGTKFFPDDAEDPDDIATAEGYDSAVELIQKHIDAKLKAIRCLLILWNQGTVFAYNHLKTSPKFGTTRVPQMEQIEVPYHDIYCQSCYEKIAVLKETIPTEPIQCPSCGWTAVPEVISRTETIEQIVDYKHEPKGRIGVELFGPLNVKVPFYARSQADIGYLHLNTDVHFAMVREQFKDDPEIYDKISGDPGKDTYERYMRLPTRYLGSVPKDLAAVTAVWFRPWMYNSLERELRDQLSQMFPNGIYAMIVNGDCVAEAIDENLDDHWTISEDALSSYIHGEALGKPLQDVQIMTNDLANLTLQTIEYGIPETFANPLVLDFDKFGGSAAAPGMVTPAKPEPGKSLADGFHTVKTASLSQEVQMFTKQLEQFGQFLVGDFPSVYGGPAEGSKTATEYQQSGARALQRLSLVWTKLTFFWSKMMSKCAVEYVEQMKEDERYVKKINGKFMNAWVRKTMMTGKIGHVEPESNEQLPMSWIQKRDQIMKLMGMGNENLDAVVFAPENAELMKQAFAMHELYIPNEEDRVKQFDEIYQMMEIYSPDGQLLFDGVQCTVPIDQMMDNHEVHMRILKCYMNTLQGLQTKKEKPEIWQNWMLHYQMHYMYVQQQMMMQAASAAQSTSKGNENVEQPTQ